MKNVKKENWFHSVNLLAILLLLASCGGPSAEKIANETCLCIESMLGDKLFTEKDVEYHLDSCSNLMKFKYKTDENEDLQKELLLFEKQINASLEKVNDAYNNQIEDVSEKIAKVYDETTSENYWISDMLYNNLSDSINELIEEWYGVDSNHEIIFKALESDAVKNAKKMFQKKYYDQPYGELSPYRMIEYQGDIEKYQRHNKIKIVKNARYLFSMYLPPNFMYEGFIRGIATVMTDGEIRIMKDMSSEKFKNPNSEELWIKDIFKKNYLTNFKEAKYSDDTRSSGTLDWYVVCENVDNSEILNGKEDSEILLVGYYDDYYIMQHPYWGTTTSKYVIFENCEIVGIYKNMELSKENLNFLDEYIKFLKNNNSFETFDKNENLEMKNKNNVEDDNFSQSKCDKFLIDYEDFMKDYIAVLKKYKTNPTDPSILSDYTKMVQQAAEWEYDENCANDPKFIGKYTEIQMKIANAAAEL